MTEPIPVTGTISGRFTVDLFDDDRYIEYELDLTTATGLEVPLGGIRMPKLRSWAQLPGTRIRRHTVLVEGDERVDLSGTGVVVLDGDEQLVAVERLDFAGDTDPGTVRLRLDLVDQDSGRPSLRLAGAARIGAIAVADDELTDAARLLDLATFRRATGDGVILLHPAG